MGTSRVPRPSAQKKWLNTPIFALCTHFSAQNTQYHTTERPPHPLLKPHMHHQHHLFVRTATIHPAVAEIYLKPTFVTNSIFTRRMHIPLPHPPPPDIHTGGPLIGDVRDSSYGGVPYRGTPWGAQPKKHMFSKNHPFMQLDLPLVYANVGRSQNGARCLQTSQTLYPTHRLRSASPFTRDVWDGDFVVM